MTEYDVWNWLADLREAIDHNGCQGDAIKTISIRFSCTRCGAKQALVSVRARESAEDLRRWIDEVVGAAISRRHSRFCDHLRVDLYIPIPLNKETGWVGQAVEDGAVYKTPDEPGIAPPREMV